MFLTMTELPETPAATRSVLNWWLLKRPAMTPDTPFISMIWPSTTVSGWRPSKPRLTSESAPVVPCNSTALTELEPMSRPTSPFLPSFFLNIILSVPGGVMLSSAVESAEARSRAQDPRVRCARGRRVRVHGGVHLSRVHVTRRQVHLSPLIQHERLTASGRFYDAIRQAASGGSQRPGWFHDRQ